MKIDQIRPARLINTLKQNDTLYLFAYFCLSLISWRLTVYAASVASQWLGPALYGDFNVSIRLAHNLTHIFVMGQEAIILMFLSNYQNDPDKQAGLIHWIIKSIIIKTVVLFTIIGLAYTFHSTAPFSWIHLNIWTGLFAIPFVVASGIYERFFLYMKSFFISFMPRGIYQPILFLIMINLFFIPGGNQATTEIIYLYACSFIVCSLIAAAHGYYSGFKLSKTQDTSDKRKWHTSGLFYTFSTLIIKSTPSIALLFLEYLHPSEIAVGHFGAIINLTYGYHLLTKSFDSYLKPSIAQLFSAGKIQELQNTINKITRVRWAIIILFTTYIITFGSSLLFDFGESFTQAYNPLLILSLFFMIQYLGQPAHEILNYTGNQETLSGIMALQFLSIATLCAILIPIYGIIGAVIAQGLPSALATAASAYTLKKKTSLKLYFLF